MTSAAQLGFQTQVKRGSGTGTAEVFTAIEEVIGDIAVGSAKRDRKEVTPHKTADWYREFKPGLIDPGDVKFKMNYVTDSTTQAAVEADFNDAVIHNWQIVFPDSSGVAFKAFPTEFARDSPGEDAITISVTLAITGAITELP
jgi:predicted secreted protein